MRQRHVVPVSVLAWPSPHTCLRAHIVLVRGHGHWVRPAPIQGDFISVMPAKISFPNRSPAQGAGGRESWAGELHLRRAEGQAQNQGGPFRACVTHRLLDPSKLPRGTLLGFFLKTVFEGTQVWGFPGSTPQAKEAWPAARWAGEAPRREVTRARGRPPLSQQRPDEAQRAPAPGLCRAAAAPGGGLRLRLENSEATEER